MLIGWKFEKFVVPLVVVGLTAYMSYQPKFRLRTDMPSEFVDAAATLPIRKRAPEEQIARVYWSCAVTNIQWRYSRTYLPPSPPPEFSITGEDPGRAPSDESTRVRYWAKLQEVWYLPNTWTKSYEWDFGWLKDPLAFLRVRFSNYIANLSDLL